MKYILYKKQGQHHRAKHTYAGESKLHKFPNFFLFHLSYTKKAYFSLHKEVANV